MAIMIPEKPINIPSGSHEDEMFEALKRLSDDYYVFHSFVILDIVNGVQYQSETDFVIFNPHKGILCLEAKATYPKYQAGNWYYANDEIMSHGGPYKQADANVWKLQKLFKKKRMYDLWFKCKILHAVWFPLVPRAYFNGKSFPADADMAITLFQESLVNIEEDIERIFSIEVGNVQTSLTSMEAHRILNDVLCPSFEIIPTAVSDLSVKRNVFNRLLKEQVNILNFLEEQPYAVINGVAGTGKTMIALEKARRHAADCERVLFLCYNAQLCKYLKNNYSNAFIDYYNLDKWACTFCHTPVSDFELLSQLLETAFYEETFPYKHVIIDEGQDFGQERIEETNIIDLLETIVLSSSINGTFYLFYDKNQLVQGYQIPKYISESDCKLTLYKNCRNTENIAITSMRPLGQNKVPKMFEGCVKGESPSVYIHPSMDEIQSKLNSILDFYENKKIRDVAILTCLTEQRSCLAPYMTENESERHKEYHYRGRRYKFYSCRRFKGLEADAIVLVDVNVDSLNQNNLMFYVGASRARFYLSVVCCLSEDECNLALESLGIEPKKKPQKALAAALNGRLCQFKSKN